MGWQAHGGQWQPSANANEITHHGGEGGAQLALEQDGEDPVVAGAPTVVLVASQYTRMCPS
jgi:hypothetical protein